MRLIQSGPRNAKIVLCAEAPGKREDEEGKPFMGGAGDLLNRMLHNVGLMRGDIFITNIVHTRPPKNDFGWFLRPKMRPEYMAGVIQLKADLEEIRPNLVIAMGAQSLRVLTGKIGIMKWRGSILESTLVKGLKVIGTVHPAYCFKGDWNWPMKTVIEADLARCKRQSTFPAIVLPEREIIVDPDILTKNRLVAEMIEAEWLSIDIECFVDETQPTGWRIACVGFSDVPTRSLVLPWATAENRLIIRQMCAGPNNKIFQNGFGFDMFVLEDHDVPVKNFAWDTMAGMHTIYIECASSEDDSGLGRKKAKQPALRKGLAFQTTWFTEEQYYKDDGKLWEETGNLDMFWRYNGKDAAVTREIKDVQLEQMEEMGVVEVMKRKMSYVPTLMRMTRRGIPIDAAVHAELKTKYENEINRLQDFLDGGAGQHINVKGADVKWLLFEKLGMPVKKRSKKTDVPTADKDAINELALTHPHPLLMTILEIRERRDLIERYLNVAYDNDGRMRCAWDPTGTRTGRLASRVSIYGTGTNLQNQPPELRRMFICEPGKVLWSIDYSQAEARCVAWLARCEKLIELFLDPERDVHTENASRFFNIPVESISFAQRYVAKRTVHASNYGMGAYRFWQVVNADSRNTGIKITLQEARNAQEMYFMLYPEIKTNYWYDIREQLKATLTLENAFGLKRMFFGKWSDQFLNEAYAFYPQSTVGEMTNIAMVQVDNNVPDAELFINGHDSLIGQCDEDKLPQVAKAIQEQMCIPIMIHDRELIIPTDVEVGYNWGKQSDDNPKGLRSLAKWNEA